MQTLPRGPRVRRGFIATPGSYLVLADYSQIEQRKLASFCMDPALIEAINTGDLHTAVAEMIFGSSNPQRRQLAKSSGYAIIYGAGPEKFSHTAGVSVEEGAAFLEAYHSRFPNRSEEHTSELQSRETLVCRLLLENINQIISL